MVSACFFDRCNVHNRTGNGVISKSWNFCFHRRLSCCSGDRKCKCLCKSILFLSRPTNEINPSTLIRPSCCFRVNTNIDTAAYGKMLLM